MSRYTPRNSQEFESRQKAFSFGEACRFVAALVHDVKRTLNKWWKENRPTMPEHNFKIWHQLVLESNDLAQIPLFETSPA